MAENDEASGSDAADTPYVPTGLRRSTYTPPVDDSALAAALSAGGATPPKPAEVAPPPPEASPQPAVPTQQASEVPPQQASEPRQGGKQAPREEPVQGVARGELPDRPRRRSLADDDLVRKLSTEVVTPGATLGAIEELQAQLLLRQEEARQFGEWESGMRAIGTPEALDSIAQAIPEFTGVIPIIAPEQSADYLARVHPPSPTDAPAPEPSQPIQQPDATSPEPPSVQYMDPEAYPPPRLEERVDAAPLEEPNLSDHLVFQPPWKRAPEPDRPAVPGEPRAPGEPRVPDEPHVPGEPQAPGEPEMLDEVRVLDAPPAPFEAVGPEAPESGEFSAPSESPSPEAVDEVEEAEEAEEAEDASGEGASSEGVAVEDAAVRADQPAADQPAADQPAAEQPAAEQPAAEQPAAEQAADGPELPVVYELVDPTASDSLASASPSSASLFERLLSGDTAGSAADEVAAPFPLLEVPLADIPLLEAAQPGESSTTASQPIILPVIEEEPEDDVDEIDRAVDEPFGATGPEPEVAAAVGESTGTGSGTAEVEPPAAPLVRAGEQAPATGEPSRQPVFGLELSGIEPTPREHRLGRAAKMFWLWFATNASVVSIAFGAALLGLGMSLRQAILAAFIGVAISFLPLGLGTLAGKWSGQPTIVVSRATFGLVGNIAPAILALITRLFWGAVLLWLLAVCTARILVGASLAGPFTEMQLTLVVIAVGLVLAFLVAFLGYPLFARLQLVLSIVSAVLILGLFVVTWNTIDLRAALSIGDGPWVLVITGIVLVFSFIGLVWANGSGDVARYQRPGSSGASASLWASFGATLPAFLLIAYGALLAASSPSLLKGFQSIPIDTITTLIPSWYPVPLIAATVLSLLSAVALSVYSGGFALQAVGVRLGRQWAVVAVGVAIFGVAIAMALSDAGFAGVFRDLATSLAVPVAAWAGIFAAEMMIRRKHFDTASLLRAGGVYPGVNWINFVMLFVASALGFAFTSAAVGWLSWQGYGFVLIGIPLDGPVGASDLGVLVALAIGLLTPLAAGIPAVRRQESVRR